VPSTNYLVTLTADDGVNTTVFTFTFAVSSNVDATINLPAGSVFTGSAATGYAASIGPAALSGNFTLQLFDGDANTVNVTAVSVVPSAPAGITAPGVSSNNPSGTVVSFSGNANVAVPGTYTWTFTVHDVFGTPADVDVSITVLNVAAAHTAGVEAAGGNGSAATPYNATRGLGAAPPPTVTLAVVSDANIAQTLTEVSVTGDAANPSNVFSATFAGTGNAGVITMTASAKLTVADVGEHTFTVQVSDGVTTVSIVVRVVVDTSGNTQPTAGRPIGSTFLGTQAAGFTLTLGPNEGLTANAILELTDGESDPIQVVSVTGGGITGVTAPVAVAVATSLAWTGTVDSSNDPGVYEYTIVFRDNVTTPVTITVSITVLNVAPTRTPATGVTGDGSTALPYTISHEVGRAAPKEIVTLADVNTSQTATLAGFVAAPGNPSGGSGFVIAQTGDSIFAVPTAVLKNRDVGVHRFTVTVSDGISSVAFDVTVKVTAPPADKPSPDGCAASGSGGAIWVVLLAALLAAPIWVRKRLQS
jgi:hypothetical protein